MSGLILSIPERLRNRAAEAALLEFLRESPFPMKYKKYLLVEWTKFVGVELTKELVEKAGIKE